MNKNIEKLRREVIIKEIKNEIETLERKLENVITRSLSTACLDQLDREINRLKNLSARTNYRWSQITTSTLYTELEKTDYQDYHEIIKRTWELLERIKKMGEEITGVSQPFA